MPLRDLRLCNGRLNPLAPFIVLGTMCYPRKEDQQNRNRMLSTIRAQTGEGKPRAGIQTTPEFEQEVDYHARRAGIAGSLLMTCIQRHELGEDDSLDAAINSIKTLPDRWVNLEGFAFDRDAYKSHTPHSRRKMVDAFNRYLPAAHLWASYLHGEQNERPDISPANNATLPLFLTYAEAFAEKAAKVPFRGSNHRVLLPVKLRWRFTVPEQLIREATIGPALSG